MSRQVRCEICNILLGDIKEAKLHKKIKYLCSDCLEEICPRDNDLYHGDSPYKGHLDKGSYVNKQSEDFMNVFSNFFKGSNPHDKR